MKEPKPKNSQQKEIKPLPEAVVTSDKVILNGAYRIPIPAVDEWVIIQPEIEKSKKILAQVLKSGKDKVQVVFEKGREKEETRVVETIPFNQIFLNLGPQANKDFVGLSIMGVRTEFFFGKKDTIFGPAYFFTKLEKEKWKLFNKTLDRVKEILGSMYMLDRLTPIEFYFIKPAGAIDGIYTVTGEETDRITIRLKEWTPKSILWLLLHEFCHGVHAYMLSKDEWAAWIKIYHAYVNVKRDKELITEVLKDYLKQGKDYEPENEEREMVFDEAISYISEKHMLEKEYLDALLDAGDQDTIKSIWPKFADLSDQEAPVTEYAKKSPVEFFCESFAFYNMGEKSRALLPNVVRQRMENDLSNIVKRNKAKGAKA